MDKDPALTPKTPELLDLPFDKQIEYLNSLTNFGDFIETANLIAHGTTPDMLGNFEEFVQLPSEPSQSNQESIQLARYDHDSRITYGVSSSSEGNYKDTTVRYSPDTSDDVKWEVETGAPDILSEVNYAAPHTQKDEATL